MPTCAYCNANCPQTREHVIPRWYSQIPGDAETFSARAPFTHVQGDLIVKDVCRSCNSGPLSRLDTYGKELYDRYFVFPAYIGETINFQYDADRLLRWLLKISYNSARAQEADVRILRQYRKVILGELPISDHICCWLHLVTAACVDSPNGLSRPARRDEQGQANVLEPLWFRVTQLRLSSHPTISLVQRAVIINSFAFTLLVAPAKLESADSKIDQWSKVFSSIYPGARPILPGVGNIAVTAEGQHVVESMYSLLSNYPSRFSDKPDPLVFEALKAADNEAPVFVRIPRELIEVGQVESITSTFCYMVSSREKASAFKQRVGVMVDGFDKDPRELWQVPKARQFFRRIFRECPFVMWVAHPDGHLLKLLAACWTFEPTLSEEGQQQRMTTFLETAFDGLNRLCHILALSEEHNREVSTAAVNVLYGEAPPV